MKGSIRIATGIIALVTVVSTVWPQTASYAAGPASGAAPSAPAVGVDPSAMAALNKMGAYLRTLKAFQVRAVTSTDGVTEDGQLIETDAVSDLLAQAPNRMRVEVVSDDAHRLYFYNGKVITVYAERVNFYATVPAPPTIAQLTDDLYDKYDINLPFEDLFFWGTSRSDAASITAATDYGPSQVDGITCEQYAFRQPGLDWQIWVQSGDYPLPRKIVLSTTDDPAHPRHSAIFSWNLAPSYNDATFTFDPPKDAHKITLATTGATSPKKN